MLVIDKEWLDNDAFSPTKYLAKYLANYLEGMSYSIISDGIVLFPFVECEVTLYLRDMPYIFVKDGINKLKIDYLSNYTEKEPKEVFLEIDPNKKINYQEIEREFSEDETDYSDFETEIAGKEKERFDMLELDEEG